MRTARSLARPANSSRSRVTWLRVAAAAGTIALLVLVAPWVWKAVSAGLGLAALAVLGLAGAAAMQALPLAAQKLENRLLAARKAEARANPIEQLRNDVLRREERLRSFRAALVQIGAQIESMAQMIDTRRQNDPGHVLQRQQQALQRMAQFHEQNLKRLQAAQDALDAFRHQVQQKVFEWEFYVAGKQVLEVLNPSELGELLNSLLSDEALRSVQLRFNEVFAELDIDLHAADSPIRSLLQDDERQPFEALVLPRPAMERMP
ncbi:MAG: hypothetical protein MUF16_18665 [Burkholderiaceae bacterium]|jgi:hypothetical protein|nr:hypothetical protein [Burkholderiaceae bacterium]